MQPTSAKDLLEFWPRIAAQGLIAKPAASNYRNAASAILNGTNTPEDTDVKTLDIERLFRQFENLNAKRYKPDTIGVIESRFRRSLAEFLRWADNPKAFQPEIGQSRAGGDGGRPNKPRAGKREPRRESETEEESPEFQGGNAGLISYPLPLRPGVIARITVPADLSEAEVQRIAAFLRGAVIPTATGGGTS